MIDKCIKVRDGYSIKPNAMAEVNGKLLYSDYNNNGLYEWDLDSNSVVFRGTLRPGISDNKCLYVSMICHNDDYYIIPFMSDALCIYESEKNVIEELLLPIEIRGKDSLFISSVIVDEFLYLFGYGAEAVYRFNIISRSYEECRGIENELKKYINDGVVKGFGIRGCVSTNEYIYAVSINCGQLIRISCDDYKVDFFNTPACEKGFSHILIYENYLWMIPFTTGKFVRCKIDDMDMEILDTNCDVEYWSYSGACMYKDELIVLPAYYGKPLRIKKDLEYEEIESISSLMGDICGNHFNIPVCVENNIISMQPKDDGILLYDAKENNAKKQTVKSHIIPGLKGEGIICEDNIISLDCFLQQLI